MIFGDQINRNNAYKYNGFRLKWCPKMVLSGKPRFLCGLFVIISLLLLLVFLLPVSHMNWLYMTCTPCTA